MKDEPALLRAAKKLDRDALAVIFDLYAPPIYTYVLRLCHNPIDSDRLVGNVFAQFLEKLATGQGPLTNLRSYLYKIAYHLVVDQARRSKRVDTVEGVIDMPNKVVSAPTQASAEERVLMEEMVLTVNNELSELQRHVIILRFFEDFSLGETAAIIGKKLNNVKVIQNRGVAKLQKRLEIRFKSDSKNVFS
ncbi:MAG TPA: RNA polymerase sigma factor [Anaerolineales bacterium]|nr:RNA polymerase sigma factor [Anaerolineales bacterium]